MDQRRHRRQGTKRRDGGDALDVLALPLLFASSAFTPTAQMPGWLQAFADNQPISVVADAIRALGDGTDASGLVLGSILWIVGLTAFFGWLSARLYRKNA